MNAPLPATPASSANRIPAGLDAQARSFVEQGFLVAPGLVSPAELEQLKGDLVALARGAYPCESLKPVDAALTDRQVIENILCIHQPHYISPVMRSFVHHPGICDVLSRITAAHLPFWDGRVKCMQSMLFVKPPGFPGQAWHQDEIYIPSRDRSLLGAWIAIDDATVANGCLWVVPGSHRDGYLFPQKGHTDPEEFDFAPESYGFDEAAEVPVEVKAGSVVFFNGYLLHRSKKNRTDGFRRALVNHYMNAWSLLPWSIGAANADDRRVRMVAGEDPYAWKGYQEEGKEVWLRPRASAEQIAEAKAKKAEADAKAKTDS